MKLFQCIEKDEHSLSREEHIVRRVTQNLFDCKCIPVEKTPDDKRFANRIRAKIALNFRQSFSLGFLCFISITSIWEGGWVSQYAAGYQTRLFPPEEYPCRGVFRTRSVCGFLPPDSIRSRIRYRPYRRRLPRSGVRRRMFSCAGLQSKARGAYGIISTLWILYPYAGACLRHKSIYEDFYKSAGYSMNGGSRGGI